jgi:hypothetical protein
LHKSAEEVQKEIQNKLGEVFGHDYRAVEVEYLNIRTAWRFYRTLFGTNAERVDFLNEISGIFFVTIEAALFEKVMLGLCRLLDPATTGRGKGAKENLTFFTLEKHIHVTELKEAYQEKLENCVTLAEFARDWRNKRIAHADYLVASGKVDLQTASRAKLQKLIDEVGELVQFLHINLLEADLMLDPILPPSDEYQFLGVLYEGLQSRDRRLARLEEAIKQRDYDSIHSGPEVPEWLRRQKD